MLFRNLGAASLALCLFGLSAANSADAPKAEPVRIGMVSSLFTDIPQPLIQIVAAPFSSLMKEFTGLDGKMAVAGDAFETARKLNDKAIDLAVLHGVEFGWAQQKYPELRPLMVATNKNKCVRAHVIVRNDCDWKSFADMKGKIVSFPRRSKEHCRLFMEKHCVECGQCAARSFFGDLVASPNIEAALDDCLLGKVQAVITDTLALETYECLKPGCYARLKVLKDSEIFPPGVIAYRHGHLDEATLNRFRDGMIKAQCDEKGREVMAMFKINAFEPIPDDYAQGLADIIKAYPAPQAFEKISRN